MKTIQPGHDVLSLFGISAKTRALTKDSSKRGFVISLVSAFFVVLVLGSLLGLAQKALTVSSSASAATVVEQEEAVAFVPGQFVSDIIKAGQGYIGR